MPPQLKQTKTKQYQPLSVNESLPLKHVKDIIYRQDFVKTRFLKTLTILMNAIEFRLVELTKLIIIHSNSQGKKEEREKQLRNDTKTKTAQD